MFAITQPHGVHVVVDASGVFPEHLEIRESGHWSVQPSGFEDGRGSELEGRDARGPGYQFGRVAERGGRRVVHRISECFGNSEGERLLTLPEFYSAPLIHPRSQNASR